MKISCSISLIEYGQFPFYINIDILGMYATTKNTENIVQGRCINATDRSGCTSNIKTVAVNKQAITVLIVLIRLFSWYATELCVIPDNAMPVFK